MATITKSIGTASRDYSTITAWEADLDNVGVYSAGDDAVGECYNDSSFDESITLNGGGTIGLSGIILTAATGEQHDGTAGTGARIVRTATTINVLNGFTVITRPHTYSKLEITSSDSTRVSSGVACSTGAGGDISCTVSQLMIHGLNSKTEAGHGISYCNCTASFPNNVIYDCKTDVSYRPFYAIRTSIRRKYVQNNTIFNCGCDNVSNNQLALGIDVHNVGGGDGPCIVQNNIACQTYNSGTGSADDYTATATPNATTDHNISSDATASGTGSLINQSAVDLFVSIVSGSEDLHLKPGSPAIGAGANLGTSPVGVNFDIDNYDRSLAAAWDIGADQFISGVDKWSLLRRGNRMGHIGIQSSPNQHIARGIRMAQMGITL